MVTAKSINMQLALFCIIVLTLTECNESKNVYGASSNNKINVVDNLRVRDDDEHVKDYRRPNVDDITFCDQEGTKLEPFYCCSRRGRPFDCFPKEIDCNRYCA
ncbi:hypothetical protein M0R45_000555 [Rubus argutus]|uniref:Uncharacterized protein n=1 Tax=Rubus argutus TaxID=59490 RepID=A0AAW1VKG9_RUBAR